MSFLIYDITFLILFSLFIVLFLHKKRKEIKREGIIYIYRTKIGMKTINYVGKKYSKFLNAIKYVVIGLGFILMAVIIYMIGSSLYAYISIPEITETIKAPPIAPLIPYFPQLFGMQQFFPNFYFTYFIIALAVVALVHEFSHGIFMRTFNMKIKSTGFAFLGPIPGAFVEQDEKDMQKKKNIDQMAVLGAGAFANTITAFIFFMVILGLFYTAFQPAGYMFNHRNLMNPQIISIENISGYNNRSYDVIEIYSGNNTYYSTYDYLEIQLSNKSAKEIIVFEGSPAIKNDLRGVIIQADNTQIKNQEDLQDFLSDKRPGDKIKLKTKLNNETKEYNITLDKHPENESRGFLGIGFIEPDSGLFSKLMIHIMQLRNPTLYKAPTYYEQKWNFGLIMFVFELLWWVAMINFFVGLFNMLPLGILDGGRFFYLTILSITKSDKTAKILFKATTYLIIFVFALMTIIWFLRI
ncbi:MAG: site-2 protease family protein [Nanoarchaeota archaeon]